MFEKIRKKINFDWKFYKGDIRGGEKAVIDEKNWQPVDLPHDWTIEGPPSQESSRVNGYFPDGIGWYRKYLVLGNSYKGKQVRLEFEGIFRNSAIWVNGEKAGNHLYGYTGVVFDISESVRFNDDPNIISVRVDGRSCIPDPIMLPPTKDGSWRREGWWYEGCGIYRNVWLIISDKLHMDDWGIFITTPEVSKSKATVNIKTMVKNDYLGEKQFKLRTTILDRDGSVIAKMQTGGVLPGLSSKETEHETVISCPHLWSPAEPYLYTAKSELSMSGETIDTHETAFGIRWFEFTPDRGYFLNGRHMQLKGMNIHHDFGGLGVALPDRAHWKNVEIMKETGCNILRSSSNDAAPALMDACDRLGMLVWAETRYLDVPEISVPPLRDLIRRNRNHPSIICWSLANTAGSEDGKDTGYLRALNDAAHDEDHTRPTTFACEANCNANANGFSFVTDIMGYNGGGMGKDYADHINYPERKILISEYSSGQGSRGVYREKIIGEVKLVKYGDGRILKHAGQYCSIYSLCKSHESAWARIDEHKWCAGGIMWTGIDYFGETVGWPVVTSQFGVLDVCRFPKDAWYYYLQEWTDRPVLHVFPHWTWPGDEGRIKNVCCYSNCDEVELSLNGKSLGVKPRMRLSHNEWLVPYEPGVLKASGKKDGKVICTEEIQTAGSPAAIDIEADKDLINADGEDLSFVTIRINDKHGTMVPDAGNKITINLQGEGRLIGLCSGDPACHDSPRTDSMNAYNGLLLAIVQSTLKPGKISLAACSGGLSPYRIEIKSNQAT